MFTKRLLAVSFVLGANFVCSVVSAAETKTPVTRMASPSVANATPIAVIIACPSKLTNVNLSIDAQYTAPSGWAAKTFPTGYNSQTLVPSMHSVSGGKMHCTYAQTSLPSSYRLTTVSKPVPAGKSCTAVTGYKFSCQ